MDFNSNKHSYMEVFRCLTSSTTKGLNSKQTVKNMNFDCGKHSYIEVLRDLYGGHNECSTHRKRMGSITNNVCNLTYHVTMSIIMLFTKLYVRIMSFLICTF